MTSIVQQIARINEPANREDLGTRLSCSRIVTTKWRNISLVSRGSEEVGELLATNLARTARRQLDGRHLLLENICRPEQPLFIS